VLGLKFTILYYLIFKFNILAIFKLQANGTKKRRKCFSATATFLYLVKRRQVKPFLSLRQKC